jgi:hypothetical protein
MNDQDGYPQSRNIWLPWVLERSARLSLHETLLGVASLQAAIGALV